MTRVVFPQEAVTQYVSALLQVVGLAMRDVATLNRQASSLTSKSHHGRVLGYLITYANDGKQFGADQVREIVADMETFVDPKIVKHKKLIEAGREARAEERRERDEATEKASWEPGGQSFRQALGQMKADAHTLIFAAKTIEDGDDPRLIGALRGYCEDEERGRFFARLSDNLKPPPKVLPAPAKRCSRRRANSRDDKVVRLFNNTTRPRGSAGEESGDMEA